MSYDVSFKAKLEGTDQWARVGDDWINHTCNTSMMIKEVCGATPSEWNGQKCGHLYPIIMGGAAILKAKPEDYRKFEPDNKWGTVETTIKFLEKIAENCKKYPTAIIEVC